MLKSKNVLGGAALLAASAMAYPAVSADNIVIGYAAAVTGELAPYDSPDGVRCQVEIINESGGILGKQVELVIRDMKSDSSLSGTAAQELIDLGASVLLGPPTDDSIIPIAMLALPHNIATLSVGGTQPAFPTAAPQNGYLVPYGDNASAAAAAEFAYENGARSVVLLVSHDIGSYSLITPEYFATAFERLGGKVLGRINYNSGLADYTPQITEIKSMDEKPDIIFGGMIVPEAGVFPRQLAAAGLDIPVYNTDGADDPGVLDVAGDAAHLVKFTTHGFPSEGSALKAFYDNCEARGYTVQNIFFGLGGEAMVLVKAAMEAAGSSEPAAVNAALKEIENLEGITTDSITYKGQGGIPLKNMTMIEVVDGKFTPAKNVLPGFVPNP
jgi:branched-chain amino acid transport system substrate-binding protein